MDDKRLELRVSGELLAEIDRVRGKLARSAFVKDSVRRALGVLGSPEMAKARAVFESRPETHSGVPPHVVSAGVSDREVSCPECAGQLFPVDGGRVACRECGWTR